MPVSTVVHLRGTEKYNVDHFNPKDREEFDILTISFPDGGEVSIFSLDGFAGLKRVLNETKEV